jgi:hypothetical protein
MTEVPGKRALPRVEDADFNYLLFEDIVDPTHKARFEHFASQNPALIQEVVRRALTDSTDLHRYAKGDSLGMVELQKVIIDTVTFTLGALEAAADREYLVQSMSDDFYGEDQLRSDEPGDDLPAE